MAEDAFPATFVGIVVDEEEWTGPDGPMQSSKVRLHFEVKKSDWENVEALQGHPGITVLPDGTGVVLDPTNALVVLKGEEAEGKPA